MLSKIALGLAATAIAALPATANAEGRHGYDGGYSHQYSGSQYRNTHYSGSSYSGARYAYSGSRYRPSYGYGGYGGYGYARPTYSTRIVIGSGYGYPGYGYGYPAYGYGYPSYGYGYPAAYGYGYHAYGYSNYYGGYDRCGVNGAGGMLAGGAVGAVLGSALSSGGHYSYRYGHYRHGNGAAGAIIGGVLGAAVGAAAASSNCY